MLWSPLRQIRSEQPAKRAKAARALAASRDPRAVPALVAALKDPDVNVRRAAAASLGDCGGDAAARALAQALWDRGSYVQWEASEALDKIGLTALQHLVPGLDSADPAVREAAVQLVQRIGARGAGGSPADWQAGPAAGDRDAREGEAEGDEDEDEDEDDQDEQEDEGDSACGDGSAVPTGQDAGELIEMAMMSGDPATARRIAKSLCDSPDPAAWEALAAAEVGRDAEMARLASKALAKLCRLGDVRAMRPDVAERVVEQLRDVPGAHSVEVFRRSLGHADPRVRGLGLQVLEQRGVRAADDPERRLRALIEGDEEALRKLGPGAVPELLIAQLRGEDRYHRADAAEMLGKLGDGRAVEPLIEALRDAEERVRGTAVLSLGQLRDARAVEPLTLRLRDGDTWVATRAADALGDFGDARAVPALAAAARALDKSLRRSAVRALATIGGPDAVAPLGEAMGDADAEVRQIAAGGLADVGGERAGKLLAAALSDEDDAVRSAAARGLARAGGDAEPTTGQEAALIAALRSPGRAARRSAAEALQARGWQPGDDAEQALLLVAMENPLTAEALGEAAVDALCLALRDGGHYYLSQTAAECLGRILVPAAVPALCAALAESDDMTVRGAAAAALGQIRDPAAVEALATAASREPEAWVRRYVAAALAKIGEPAAQALRLAARDKDEQTRQAAERGLGGIEAGVEPDRLVAALGDEEPKVRLRAAVLLCRRGDPRGLAWLEQAARADDSLLREKAIEAIGRGGGPAAVRALLGRICAGGFDGPNEAVAALVAMGESAAGPMVAALPAMDHNARWATLSGLARLGAPAMAALCAALPGADGELKSIVCEVLGRMDDRERVPHVPVEPMVFLLEDADARVRHAAAHGLSLLKWEPRDERERGLLARAKG